MVISTGGGDMTLLLWETDLAQGEPVQQQMVEESADGNDYFMDDPSNESKKDHSKEQKAEQKRQKQESLKKAKEEKKVAGQFDEEEDDEGDQFMAVKPWMGQMKPPSTFKKPERNSDLAPVVKLDLEWVHGYRGSQGRNNLKYMNNGSLCYHAAGVGIAYDPVAHSQKFFNLHTDDITCIAYSPDGVHVATGENGKKPICYIWNSDTQMKKWKFEGNGIVRNIFTIAYSPSGGFLAVIDESDDHNIAVYDTNTGVCVAKNKGDKAKIQSCAWQNEEFFVTVGPKHFKQWNVNANNLSSKLGNFGGANQIHTGAVFNGQTCLTGSVEGQLYQWNGTALGANPKKLHERLIEAILVTPSHIFTGARDSKINVLDPKNYATMFTIDCSTLPESVCSWVRAITINEAKDTLMVGTFGHEIYQVPINLQTKKQAGKAVVKIQGHYAPKMQDNNEVWGLTVFNNKEQYVTVSDDGTLRVWDLNQRTQVKVISLNVDEKGQKLTADANSKKGKGSGEVANLAFQGDGQVANLPLAAQGRCCDVSPKGDYLAVGMRDGTLRIYETSTWKLTYLKKIANEWFEEIRFSPNGEYLACGSHDPKNYIQVFKMKDMTKQPFSNKSSAFITHMDWSLDSSALRTNDGSYELLFYNVQGGNQDTSGATNYRDELWASNSCVITWGTQGIWQKGQDGSDINGCDRSHKPVFDGMQLIATGDDLGKVNLFRYPTVKEGAKFVKGVGHSSHVTKVRWNAKDTHILSTGGNDTTVMQWKLNNK